MFPTDGDDLGVEDEVAARIGFAHAVQKMPWIIGTGDKNLQRRAGQQAFERRRNLGQGGRWVEYPWMGDHAHELADAEDGYTPRPAAFGQGRKPGKSLFVLGEFLAVRVDENVCINRDHERPSMRS